VYSKTFGFLFKKPILLWGLSLLCGLLSLLAITYGIFPLVWMPIVLVLQLGMVNIFLCGYRGEPISATQLFEGFREGKFLRNAGGMGWRYLWLLIWGLIPVAGPILCIIKYYSYRFVPYIMLAEPEITATDALKKSMAQTDGYRGKMFLADFLIALVIGGILFILFLITFLVFMIPTVGPYIGVLFLLVAGLVTVVIAALLPIFMGTIEAVYYDKISKENPVN